MIRHLLSIAILTLTTAVTASCTGQRLTSDDLREAELAIADGDMTAARSVADRLLGPNSMSDMSARDLARLSMVYMRMAEDENDNTALVATAADLYRQALKENPDSAIEYYHSLDATDEALATRLHHIVVATDSAGVIPSDLHNDSIF